ncbi:MAG: hypothetical protein LQ342_002323 [Letrouitia transgressa]|nr:MAG: hypothetical protein LQ342_002323 [Letrouitia transgressa]
MKGGIKGFIQTGGKEAGACAAFTVDFLIYPLDTIKTRLQSPDYKRLYTHGTANTVSKPLFRGLYQGIGSVVLATLPSSGAFFTTYEGTKTLFHNANPQLLSGQALVPIPVVHAAASSTGELVSCLILTPAEVLKQNAQMVRKPATGPGSSSRAFDSHATRVAFAKFKNNPLQLWRGYTALVARNLPFTAMHFPLFEHLRMMTHRYRKKQGTATGSLWETGTVTAFSAGTAGSFAAVITTPIDVVKTRIMLSAASKREDGAREQAIKQIRAEERDAKAEIEKAQQAARGGRAGAFAVGREVLRTDGLKGLFRGGALRGLWTAMGSGLYLGVYESGRKYLENRRVGNKEVTIS